MKLLMLVFLVFFNPVQLESIMDNILNYITKNIDLNKIKTLDINIMCVLQIEIIQNNKDILLTMIDASAKIPYSGMLDSGRMEFGNFDECIGIDRSVNGIRMLGKYCFAGLVIPDITNITNVDKYYKLATCVPEACSAKDLLTIANSLLFEGFPPIFLDDYCTTKETGTEFTTGNLISMFIIFLIIAIVLFSTVCDIYCQKTGEKAHPLLVAFSVVTNTKNLLKVSLTPSKETIQIFSGFRSVSVAWIIAGHGSQLYEKGIIPATNYDHLFTMMNTKELTYMYAATLSVTTFFFMSGFLLSYLYFKRKPQHWITQVKNVPVLYIHRYIRLTAPLVIIYIIILYIYEKLGNGPLWFSGCEEEIKNCRKFGWSYFLYLQNYINWDQMCLIPLWYLSADMQLFLLAPLILIPTSLIMNRPNGFKFAMLWLVLLNIFFVILNIGIREFFPETTKNTFDTHGRLAEYFIGLTMGTFMRFKKEEPFFGTLRRSLVSVMNVIIWIIVLSLMFCLFLFYEDAVIKFNHINKTLFMSFGNVIWAIGLCWMVYSCYHGFGGFINWLLCRPIFQIWGKLSYSMYLTHYLILGHYASSNRIKLYFSHYTEFYLFCGFFIETLIVSFIWSLGIESPILTIEKYLFSKVTRQEAVQENHIKSTESVA